LLDAVNQAISSNAALAQHVSNSSVENTAREALGSEYEFVKNVGNTVSGDVDKALDVAKSTADSLNNVSSTLGKAGGLPLILIVVVIGLIVLVYAGLRIPARS
jgi:hypothetical protein